MTLDREFLDKWLPDTPALARMAESITGITFATDAQRVALAETVHTGLAWLANFTEKDRFPRFADYEWKNPDSPNYDPFGPCWSIRLDCLGYKCSSHYLTNEGYGTGTIGWYVLIESGHREFICADTQHLAVLRAIIYVHVLAEQRKLAPKLRVHEREAVQEFVTKFAREAQRSSAKS